MLKVKFKTTLIIALLFSLSTLYGQQTLEETMMHDGVQRAYTIYIPANYESTSKAPLLFNFHGGSGDIASQLFISDMRPIADTAGFILVYPQALPDPSDDGATLWTHKEPTEVDDVFFVEAMIDKLSDEYRIDEDRVYACGYSNGGEFSFELACRLSHRIAAIGVVARSMFVETFDNCAPTHPIGIVTIHGTDDSYEGISFAGINYYLGLEEVNEYWSTYNNTDSDPIIVDLPNTNTSDGSRVEHHSWNNGDACVTVEHYKVINGGHDWPGSFGNMDIDASLEIWNYVSKYNLSGAIDCSSVAIDASFIDENDIEIAPNPTNGYINVEVKNGGTPMKYEVYTTLGQQVLNGEVNSDSHQIDLSPLAGKLYFLKIGGKVFKVLKK